MPGLVKIGMTTTRPEQHAREMSASSIVPGAFQLLCAIETGDAPNIEADLHQIFAARRFKNRDFFEVDVEAVLAAFRLFRREASPCNSEESLATDPAERVSAEAIRPLSNAGVSLNDAREAYTGWQDGDEENGAAGKSI